MNRDEMLARVRARREPWDVIVIGGGATGMGVAVDAASRGLAVLLLEREDFGKATSGRSTKMMHGGVRYLEQGDIRLVMEDLRERGIARRNAPHLVHDMSFVVPAYAWWQVPFYGGGLMLYDLLAGRRSFGRSRILSRREALRRVPTLQAQGLRGGALYHDGQFDDARMLVHLAMTAAEQGATLANYCAVVGLSPDGGVTARDGESGHEFALSARVVVNATGIFADEVRRLADPAAEAMLAPSQGVHLVFDRSFLPGNDAMLVPHTRDGRVLFAIPWHGHVFVGTTDTPVTGPLYEPVPQAMEIDFILDTMGQYFARKPTRADILSVFTGIRPLVKGRAAPAGAAPARAAQASTASLSRSHTVRIESSRLVTIVGGKWTTYRAMAEDAVDRALELARLAAGPCVTRTLRLHGWSEREMGDLAVYGADAAAIRQLAADDATLALPLHPALPYIAAEVVWAVRFEMARTLDDVLARRLRALFLDAQAAIDMAPKVATLMARELGRDEAWIEAERARFAEVARNYLPPA